MLRSGDGLLGNVDLDLFWVDDVYLLEKLLKKVEGALGEIVEGVETVERV